MSSHTFSDYAQCFFFMLYIYLLKPYTVEVRNTFKGLDLIDRGPDELWTEVQDIVQETRIKTIPMEKICKKQMAVWGGLTNSCEKKRSKKQRR